VKCDDTKDGWQEHESMRNRKKEKTKIKKGRKKLFTVQMIWQILKEISFDSNL